MEVKVYLNASAFQKHSHTFCRRIENQDVFDYQKCIDVFKAIFGVNCVIEFLVL